MGRMRVSIVVNVTVADDAYPTDVAAAFEDQDSVQANKIPFRGMKVTYSNNQITCTITYDTTETSQKSVFETAESAGPITDVSLEKRY